MLDHFCVCCWKTTWFSHSWCETDHWLRSELFAVQKHFDKQKATSARIISPVQVLAELVKIHSFSVDMLFLSIWSAKNAQDQQKQLVTQ